jgi:hypothetical protein
VVVRQGVEALEGEVDTRASDLADLEPTLLGGFDHGLAEEPFVEEPPSGLMTAFRAARADPLAFRPRAHPAVAGYRHPAAFGAPVFPLYYSENRPLTGALPIPLVRSSN